MLQKLYHPSNVLNLESLDDLFTYHPATISDAEKYVKIRAKAKEFAATVLENCPSCSDQSAAIRKIREAVMTANAAIALNRKGEG